MKHVFVCNKYPTTRLLALASVPKELTICNPINARRSSIAHPSGSGCMSEMRRF